MKTFIIILLSLLISTASYASTFVSYRISSGEVVNIASVEINYPSAMFITIVDPTFIDGQEFQDPQGQRLVLGYTKIYIGGVVRNATQQEIDGFESARVDGYNQIEADKAKDQFQNDPNLRRILIALIKGIIREDNQNRLWIRDFKAAVAASTSLADFQSRVAALDTPTDREFQDAKDYIIGQVSKDD